MMVRGGTVDLDLDLDLDLDVDLVHSGCNTKVQDHVGLRASARAVIRCGCSTAIPSLVLGS